MKRRGFCALFSDVPQLPEGVMRPAHTRGKMRNRTRVFDCHGDIVKE
jgi:translation initiation factor IF-1